MMQLTLTRPDDLHLHLRDGAAMTDVLGDSARQFARAMVMPNLKPPVRTLEEARAYRQRILAALPEGSDFEPLMSLYLTDNTRCEDLREAHASGLVRAVKYYPAGATTNADAGVTDIMRVQAQLECLAELGMPLLVHGEATDPGVDIFDRERVFIDRVLAPLLRRIPGLRLVLEHVTTREGVDLVASGPPSLAATITVHHLLLNRNALFDGGLRPHHYCLPVLKREEHRQALLAAATGGDPSFFLGTDSAPHPRGAKEGGCGCAGIYTAHNALGLYAEVFEEAGALPALEAFASHHGADFYGLPRNSGRIVLLREPKAIPETLPMGVDRLVPYRAGGQCRWRIQSETA